MVILFQAGTYYNAIRHTEVLGHVAGFDPCVERHRNSIAHRFIRVLHHREVWFSTGHRSGDEEDIHQRRDDRALGALGHAAVPQRRGELRRYVGEDAHTFGINLAAVAIQPRHIGRPQPQVALVHTRDYLTNEGSAGRLGDSQRCLGVPQKVHTKETVGGTQFCDNASHHGHALEVGMKSVRSVIFIAEHDRIHPAVQQITDVLVHPLDDALHP